MRTTLFTVAVLLFFTVFLAVPPARAAAFLTGTDDVPLMAGLIEQSDGAVAFDSADGRIVEVTATGAESPAAVRAFYGETLPQLGWKKKKADVWRREGEELRLTFPSPGTVHFVMTPVRQ